MSKVKIRVPPLSKHRKTSLTSKITKRKNEEPDFDLTSQEMKELVDILDEKE